MIPNAKIDALLNAPPEKMFNNPINPLPSTWLCNACKASGLMPGITTKLPKRYTKIKANVNKIRLRNSSILNIFLMVSINFLIADI